MLMDKYRNSFSRKLRKLGRLKARSIEIKDSPEQHFQMIHTPDRLTPTRPTPTEEECREEIRKWHKAADAERYGSENIGGDSRGRSDRPQGSSTKPALESATPRRNRRAAGSWAATAPWSKKDSPIGDAEEEEEELGDDPPYSRDIVQKSRRGAVGNEESFRASGYEAYPQFHLPSRFSESDLDPPLESSTPPERSLCSSPAPIPVPRASMYRLRRRSTRSPSPSHLMNISTSDQNPPKEPPPSPPAAPSSLSLPLPTSQCSSLSIPPPSLQEMTFLSLSEDKGRLSFQERDKTHQVYVQSAHSGRSFTSNGRRAYLCGDDEADPEAIMTLPRAKKRAKSVGEKGRGEEREEEKDAEALMDIYIEYDYDCHI